MSALGWQVVTRDGVEIVWHSGATGGYSAFVAYVPSRAVGVVVLANNAGAAGGSVDDLWDALARSACAAGKAHSQSHTDHGGRRRARPFAGTYEIAPGFLVAVAHEEGRLFVTPPGQPTHEGFAESERMFFTTIANVQFSFEADATGPAKAMTLHQAGKSMTGKRVDVAALPPAPPRQVVTVKPNVLETWVGRYQLTPAVFITVTRQEARLFGQATGQGAFELFPESEGSILRQGRRHRNLVRPRRARAEHRPQHSTGWRHSPTETRGMTAATLLSRRSSPKSSMLHHDDCGHRFAGRQAPMQTPRAGIVEDAPASIPSAPPTSTTPSPKTWNTTRRPSGDTAGVRTRRPRCGVSMTMSSRPSRWLITNCSPWL